MFWLYPDGSSLFIGTLTSRPDAPDQPNAQLSVHSLSLVFTPYEVVSSSVEDRINTNLFLFCPACHRVAEFRRRYAFPFSRFYSTYRPCFWVDLAF
jgi:hypothetical protein